MRSECPFCGAESWQELGAEAMGEAAGRLAKVSARYAAEIEASKKAVMDAVAARDPQALRAALERDSELELRTFEEADYFAVMGLRSEEEIEAYKGQHLQAQLDVWMAHIGETSSPYASAQPAAAASASQVEFTYPEALMNRDLDELVTRFRREMAAMYRQSGLSAADIGSSIETSLEQLLRDQPWVSRQDLERHGIKTTYDATREDDQLSVDCQQCGVAMQAPAGAESVTCAYCGAVTRLHLSGEERQAALERGLKKGGLKFSRGFPRGRS